MVSGHKCGPPLGEARERGLSKRAVGGALLFFLGDDSYRLTTSFPPGNGSVKSQTLLLLRADDLAKDSHSPLQRTK